MSGLRTTPPFLETTNIGKAPVRRNPLSFQAPHDPGGTEDRREGGS